MRVDRKLLLIILWFVPSTLITIYIGNLYSWLTGDYLQNIQKIISYKLLLQICLLLMSGIIPLVYFLLSGEQKKGSVVNKELEDKALHNLSNDEKILLQKFINKRTACLKLSKQDSVAVGLVGKGILSVPEHINWVLLPTVTFCINEHYLLYFKKFPEMLN